MSNKTSILLVEDDQSFGGVLRDYLSLNGYKVLLKEDGEHGISAFENGTFDLVITDVMMPFKDGFTLAEEIRKINAEVPLIFLTARSQKEDVLRGYRTGADDYIAKPFDSEVLLYKIKAVLSRKQASRIPPAIFTLGKFSFDPSGRVLSGGETPEKLSPRESELLQLLLTFANQVLPRQEALKKIWGDDSYFNARSMDVYVTRLRRKLKADPRIQIETVYGTGFKLYLPQE
jgi:two-component system OmpR family response regulator